MPLKELSLVARDIAFYATGAADVAPSDWANDDRLYPLDWGYQLDRPRDYYSPIDAAGVPMRELPAGLGLTYLPSRIAGYACANYNRYCEQPGEERFRLGFMNALTWMLAQPDGLFWQKFDLLSLRSPWLTCINQGECASVLVRGYRLTGDYRMADHALSALEPMFVSVANGGLQATLPDGSLFLEEYPGTQYRHVLNGCLYALVGLQDVVQAGLDRNGRAAALRDAILDGIERNLDGWQHGNWTTYDFRDRSGVGSARPNPNTLTYQTLQWVLVDYLGRKLDRPVLVEAAARWRGAASSILVRSNALLGKLRYRLGHGYHV